MSKNVLNDWRASREYGRFLYFMLLQIHFNRTPFHGFKKEAL
ncbi:hypothetical protein CHCC14809_2621 [Bacillus licheniformis]|nr:hypothetical protein B4090_0755 [Bacillus licheniformis]TWJ84141.1 hypothetical protein CHCC20495_1212 [Bacillus licheniformis]TWJ94492.1 hypothetical protein CHCC20493_0652 [Bacillus licheniformis]TWK01849.1 hypothetical protein CHCC20487_2603 [Bacillus licheniformis]TWK08496.1 hypothetical protein CHCC20442_4209 [Bacillus licheniformis]